jgi:hypothetical protein
MVDPNTLRTALELLRYTEEQQIARAREDVNSFIEYVGYNTRAKADSGLIPKIVQSPFHVELQRLMDEHPRLGIMTSPETGKEIPVQTPIPTPGGFVPMGDLKVGDEVFDRHGRRCNVVFVSPIETPAVSYRIEFDDGTFMDACSDHQWWVRDTTSMHPALCVKTTQDLVDGGVFIKSGERWRMPLSLAVQYSARDLPNDPYTCGKDLTHRADPRIPDTYLTASIEQRRNLLAGLLSGSGEDPGQLDKLSGQVELTIWYHGLAHDALELIRSLGFKATINVEHAPFTKTCYRITFDGHHTKSLYRTVTAITPIPSGPMRCIQVDSPDSSYIAGRGYHVTHNTTQIINRLVWLIGRNPDIRIVVASATKGGESTCRKIAQQVRSLISDSPEVRKVFPHLHKALPWEVSRFRVRRSTFAEKDYTLQIAAPGNNFTNLITGARVDLLVYDDLYDLKAVASARDRKRLMKWLTTMEERLMPDGRIILAANPWHPRDPWHEYERDMIRRPGESPWVCKKFPVYKPAVYDIPLDDVELQLPHFYPSERIEFLRKDKPPAEFARGYLCQATDDKESPFNQAKVRSLFRHPHHHEGGTGASTFKSISLQEQRDLGCHVVIGVDLAARNHAKADMSAMCVVVLWPTQHVYQLVWVESGRWRADEIGQVVLDLNKRFAPAAIIIENNAAQDYIFQVMEGLLEIDRLKAGDDTAIPTPPFQAFTTGRQKSDPINGIEGLSAEIDRDQWVMPATAPTEPCACHTPLMMLQDEIVSYTRGAHTGDHLMALWFAREGCRGLLWANDEIVEERFDELAPPDRDDEDGDEPGAEMTVIGVSDDDDDEWESVPTPRWR